MGLCPIPHRKPEVSGLPSFMDCCAIHDCSASFMRAKRSRGSRELSFLVGRGATPHKFLYSTNPIPRASMAIRLTAMETEFVKLASAVSLWQRSV